MTDGRVCTEFTTYDGVKTMEIHRHGLHDSKVLAKILDTKYYQDIPGDWILYFTNTNKRIENSKFDKLVEAGQFYIFDRDNADDDYSGYC
jgi:hypothetical protein